MYERAQEMSFARLGLSEKSRAIICEDRVVSKFDSIVSAEVANFRFLVGTLIWLDITSSITTGATPCLSGYHTHTISPQSQIRLERIMGCENWAMALIGRISMLHESKVKALELQGNLVCSEFERVLNDIRQEIQQHLARTSMENLSLSELQLIDSTTFITRIFAFMASIYLHLITFGFQNLEILDRAICKDKTLLNGLIPPNILPALLCPLFVIGTVIEEEDQPFFRDFFSSPSLTHPAFKHRERIVPILEEIWRRRVSTSLTWQDCLDLTSGLLLI
jgi:hypothetical protein